MTSIENQLKADADKYQEEIEKKFAKFNTRDNAVPVKKDIGDSYNRGYRKYNGSPFVLKLSRSAIAYLYKQLYDETVAAGKPMAGDLAVSFANYAPEELSHPEDPVLSDPKWDNKKAYQNTVMLGLWDDSKGIKPFKGKVGANLVDYYDDWHQEWP